MYKIKSFEGFDNLSVEYQVQSWLALNPNIEITNVTQSECIVVPPQPSNNVFNYVNPERKVSLTVIYKEII